MKDTDKVTLTVGQLKKLVNESRRNFYDSPEEFDEMIDYLMRLRDKVDYAIKKANSYKSTLDRNGVNPNISILSKNNFVEAIRNLNDILSYSKALPKFY